MNEDLHNTNENLLPPITQEDYDFALKVEKEYHVPLYELCWLTRELRYEFQDDWWEFDHDLKLRADYQELFASDVEIKGISITTNKGTIETKYPDRLFNYCSYAIRRMKKNIEGEINRRNTFNKSALRDDLHDTVMFYFTETSLNKFQQRVAIGLFLVYFKIGKPLMTEQEFELKSTKSLTEAQDYKHYLSDIVKSRLKKFQRIF